MEIKCSGCGAEVGPDDRFCESCGLRQPARADHAEQDLGAVVGITDRGLRHRRNEDSMASRVLDDTVITVVSDGVSVSDRPDEASRLAVDTAAERLAELIGQVGPETATEQAAAAAAAAVIDMAPSGDRDHAPACTYVSAVITPEAVTVGWIGDSRAYWLAGESQLLTADDSWAFEAVSAGRFTAEQAAADPRAHALTRWMGADAGLTPAHVTTFRPTGPGLVLLCSDGLWNYCPSAEGLAGLVMPDAVTAPLPAAKILIQFALLHGGHDNITATLTPFPPERKPR
ncbi:MAG TPA: protein phosphatase 2C domain-containing protein [Pseudonocardiaceae bacterium]